jgi:MFS family permease
MLVCPNCGFQNSQNSKFCSQCATPLQKQFSGPVQLSQPEYSFAEPHNTFVTSQAVQKPLDPSQIIQTVLQGQYPPNWRVYCGDGRLYTAWAYVLGIGAILLSVGAFLSFLFAQPTADPSNPWPTIFLVAIIPGILMLLALVCRKTAAAKKRSLLVIFPEGVVDCYRGYVGRFGWLPFAPIQRLDLARQVQVSSSRYGSSSSTSYSLDVYFQNGTYGTWSIGGDFGYVEAIYKQIIAAHTHYQLQRRP